MVGAQHAERIKVLMHGRDKALGQLADGLVVVDRTLDDLVVDVGDVADISQRIAARTQPARHHIEDQHHAGMTDVAVVINRDAADIHAHTARIDRLESFLAAGKRVMDAEHVGRRGADG